VRWLRPFFPHSPFHFSSNPSPADQRSLPAVPDDAPFLTASQRELVVARLPPSANFKTNSTFDKKEIVVALKDPLTYAFLGLQLFSGLGVYGLSWWLPTIIASFGFTSTQSSQLLLIAPAAVGIVVALTTAAIIDRTFTIPRPAYVLVSKAVVIGAFIGLTLVTNKPALYALIIIATTGSYVSTFHRAQPAINAVSASYQRRFLPTIPFPTEN
jgi:hypothetical protein